MNFINYKRIDDFDLIHIINYGFKFLSLFPIADKFNASKFDKTIFSSEEYYSNIISGRLSPGQVVHLRDFIISEWIPLSPGLYFTHYAEAARENAGYSYNYEADEYEPSGKYNMVQGGVGSVRLTSKSINNNTFFVLGASSNYETYQGIPIVVNENTYYKIIEQIKSYGSIKSHLVGRIKLIPDVNLLSGPNANHCPRYWLEVEEIYDIRKPIEDIVLSIAVSYLNHDNTYGWTFKNVILNRKERYIEETKDWIHDYICRYTGNKNEPTILYDFDEQIKWFDKVEFSLEIIRRNNEINTDLLKEKIRDFNLTINGDVTIGNGNIQIKNVKDSEVNII